MVYSYTPTYYSTLHDSITSLCKTILPFSLKKRRLPAAEHQLAKMQSDNLKWQQDSFHQILNLMGLHKEGILAEHEVSAFRSHLLETLIASPAEQEQPVILRDKLLFLQELLYGKCISEEEYHASKRPLLQRLAVQGVEIEARDVIVGGAKEAKESSDEEWSVIDLKDKDEQCMLNKERSNSKTKSKHGSAMKQFKEAASVLGFATPYKPKRRMEEKSIFDSFAENKNSRSIDPHFPSSDSAKNKLSYSRENPFWDVNLREKECKTPSILMPGSSPLQPETSGKAKKKPFRTLFQREQREGHNDGADSEERGTKSTKKQWGWKRSDSEDETAPLPLNERSDSEAYLESGQLVDSPMGEGPDTKQIKKMLHSHGSSSDFFIDKVLGDRIKKELSRIQAELCTTNPSLQISDDQIEAISTKLPVDKTDLKKFFPKTWCDRYGDVVLEVVKKEFKDHLGEMESLRNAAKQRRNSSRRWATFEDDENCHPNLFAQRDHSTTPLKQQSFSPAYNSNSKSNAKCLEKSLFYHEFSGSNGAKLGTESAFSQHQNPFWTPRQG